MRARRLSRLVLVLLLSLHRIWPIQSHPGRWKLRMRGARRRVEQWQVSPYTNASSAAVTRWKSSLWTNGCREGSWKGRMLKRLVFLRGGGGGESNENDSELREEDEDEYDSGLRGEDEDQIDGDEEDDTSVDQVNEIDKTIQGSVDENDGNNPLLPHNLLPQRENRHASDIILDLSRRSSVHDNDESLDLRELISTRTADYALELEQARVEMSHTEDGHKINALPHPRKLLHYLAPKVPAIKQSPDVNLRIHSSRSDIDPGIAACILGSLAHACELYEATCNDHLKSLVAVDITEDRRLEQLVECVISGINIEKRVKESAARNRHIDHETSSDNKNDGASLKEEDLTADIEEVLDEEDAQIDEGLNIRDTCRAAFGIAVLCGQRVKTLGGVQLQDLFLAFSLRARELLLARLQLLRRDDILQGFEGSMTTEERLDQLSEEIAEDTASTVWAFACVRGLTGYRSVALFEACCSILCSSPVDLRQRAQEAAYETGNPVIGSSDVIDRLARSEMTDDDIQGDKSDNTGMNKVDDEIRRNDDVLVKEKDALLDWLSPTELTDVLWGVTLHGRSNDTSLEEEMSLSETAATLREAAFDRIIEWIGHDMRLTATAEKEESSRGFTTTDQSVDEKVSVEVVDAAGLLSTYGKPTSKEGHGMEHMVHVENSTGTNLSQSEMQEVQVVDAASLLSSLNQDKDVQIKTEILVAPSSTIENYVLSSEKRASAIFSPHDLACIAWSVTELNDTSKVEIVNMAMDILLRLGPRCISTLSGNDLSNLAWAIAKSEWLQLDISIALLQSLTSHALEMTENLNSLRFFQPPELGRLMWATAVSASKDATTNRLRGDMNVVRFADRALNAAAESPSVFSTEEMSRILFAWLELSGPDHANLDPTTSVSLGRVLATIEQSLQRWERGDDLLVGSADASSGQSTTLFGSLFGRSRDNILMEHAMSNSENEDNSRSHLPKLRDLNIDPSTLIKVSCGVNRLAATRQALAGIGGALTRVALRLMSSKHGKLLRVCSADDIVRLCEAISMSSERPDFAVGYFARLVVQLLDDSFDVTALLPCNRCTLIWSLSQLGIKCSSDGTEKHKINVLFMNRLLGGLNLVELDILSLQRLLYTIASMKYIAIGDSAVVINIMKQLAEKSQEMDSGDDLCNMAETVAMLKDDLMLLGQGQENSASEMGDRVDSNDGDVDKESLSEILDELLTMIASLAVDMAQKLTAPQIRRLLAIYSLLSFQADVLVDALDKQVSARLAILNNFSLNGNETLETLLCIAHTKSATIESALFEQSSTSIFGSIKAGIKSLFTSDETPSKDAEQEEGFTDEIAMAIKHSISATSAAAGRAEADQALLQISLGRLIKDLEDGVALDLGRSRELVHNYRRIYFVDGVVQARKSRYDKDRRDDIAKRVLSRLLP